MNTSTKTTLCLALSALAPWALLGCNDSGPRSDTAADANDEDADDEGDDDESDGGDGDTEGEPPGKEGEGMTEYPRARQVSRLSADQLHASLKVATGQEWPDYAEYAAALGRPDLAEVTEQGKSFSVSFDKFAHDAARETCRLAVDADLSLGEGGGGGETGGDEPEPSEPVILRYADASDRDHDIYVENLQYLLLRFLAVEIDDPDDTRLAPWLTLLEAPPPEDADMLGDELMAERWWAVCVGLATHPDFLSY